MFAIEEGESGGVKEVQQETVTAESPQVRQPVCRVPFALTEKVAGLVGR